ncbi:hypothetical protein ACEPAF_1010 [Sanghuangporus sanghuang]
MPISSSALPETASAVDQSTKAESTMISPVDSSSGSDTDIESSRATLVTALDSSSSLLSSLGPSSASSSSSSTGASSYSVTQKEDQQALTTDEDQRRNTSKRRRPATSRPDARTLRPLGPKHLEFGYKVARKNLSAAVATAVNELFGFSIPVRNKETEAKRPGKGCIPLLRQHPLVRKAADAVDEADRLLEEALARGENWNTKVPDEWMQQDDQTEYEWGYDKPEAKSEKETRRLRARIVRPNNLESNSRKRRTPEVKKNDVSGEKEVSASGSGDAVVQPKGKSTDVSSFSTTTGSLNERERRSRSQSPSAPKLDPSSSRAVSAEPDVPPAPAFGKRSRGRPTKTAFETAGSVMETEASAVTAQSPVLGSSMMKFRLDPPAKSQPPAAPRVQRKRGRPRKYPLPPPVPSLDQLPKNAAAAMAAQDSERRSSKRRKIISSK